MGELTWGGRVESSSRDQNLRHERGQELEDTRKNNYKEEIVCQEAEAQRKAQRGGI